MPNPDGTPKEGDKRNVNGNPQVFHNHRWHSASDDKFNTEGFMAEQGATRPSQAPAPQRRKPKTLGQNRVGKPWNYESPMEYLTAYATREAKTKAGRYLFDIFNTLSWITDYYKGKNEKRISEEQSKAMDEGFENALKNVDSWIGDADKVDSYKMSYIHRQLAKKEQELVEKYQSCKGKSDPESLRIKSEYKVYSDMYAKMDEDLTKRRLREQQLREQAQRKAEQDKADAERKEELRRKAEERKKELESKNKE